MGDLKRWGGDVVKGVGQVTQSMVDSSKSIARHLGYGTVVKSLNPKAPAPLIVPMPDEEALRQAERRKFSGKVTSGRASTVLTNQDDTLG